MGTLHNLVKFRNHLISQIEHLSLEKIIFDKITSLEKIKSLYPQNAEYCDQIKKYYFLMLRQSQFTNDSIHQQISNLDSEIDDMSGRMFDNNEYNNTFCESQFQNPEFSNSLIISHELENIIESKITEYSDWHYPALQINPKSKKWIDPMVASDPLYLIHYDIDVLKDIIKFYPDIYQNRLRLYEIADRNFSKLPRAQFSFVFCLDYFNYLSENFVGKYICEVWNLLRPGGRFMFSYTNCDLEGSALRAESLACAYASSRWLKKLCDEIGYQVIELLDFETGDAFNTHVSLAILKKPGELSTVKAGQALAEIKNK